MTHNPILQEIYDAREEILAEHKGDLEAYIRSANQRAKASGHPIAKVKQRRLRCVETAKSSNSATQDEDDQ